MTIGIGIVCDGIGVMGYCIGVVSGVMGYGIGLMSDVIGVMVWEL